MGYLLRSFHQNWNDLCPPLDDPPVMFLPSQVLNLLSRTDRKQTEIAQTRMTAPSPVEGLSDSAKTGVVREHTTVNETVCSRKIGQSRTSIERHIAQQAILIRLAIW